MIETNTTAFPGDVVPNVVQVVGSSRRNPVGHQRAACCSAAIRARPRRPTSSASRRMDSCVIVRPSPHASKVLASSRVAKNSARFRSRSSHRDRASRTAPFGCWNRPLSIARRTECFLILRQTYFHDLKRWVPTDSLSSLGRSPCHFFFPTTPIPPMHGR